MKAPNNKTPEDEKRVATFLQICEEKLRPILDEYGLVKTRVDDPGGYMYYTVIFQNETTALLVYFEWRDVYLTVQICRLVDGQVQQKWYAADPEWTCFPVEVLLTVRAPDYDQSPLLISQTYEDFSGDDAIMDDVRNQLEIYAAALREYGGDIFRGDFSVFPQLEMILKQRIEARKAEYG